MSSGSRDRENVDVMALVDSLDLAQLREVAVAAGRHEDVARGVRLASSRAAEDLRQLRSEIDRGMRSWRALDHDESCRWTAQAQPLVAEIQTRTENLAAKLLGLIERALGQVVRVIERPDVSNGSIGDLARDVLGLQAEACHARVANPVRLAQWTIRFGFDDQDSSQSIRFVTPAPWIRQACPWAEMRYADAITLRSPADTPGDIWPSSTVTAMQSWPWQAVT
jgi:hypothetical protein